ncbi:hypothetical protein, partial [Glycomyces arizonensis]|uniref:hypothetical protein n=1 Tax=Glycomyces arizonensis TaxID=256035 RepID=UPI001B7F825C
DAANVFPTGLYPDEWGPGIKADLNETAEQIEQAKVEADIKAARARVRARFATPATRQEATGTPEWATVDEPAPGTAAESEQARTGEDEQTSLPPDRTTLTPAGVTGTTGPDDPVPFLPCPPQATAAGKEHP